MNITNNSLIFSFALLFTAGCNLDSDQTPPETKQEKHFDNHWNTTNQTDKGSTTIDPSEVAEGRTSRRLTVEQLRKSIPLLFNSVTWEERFRGQNVNAFDALSRTLGGADYIEVTAPNTDPSPLFAKFMDDMAGNVCDTAIRADVQTTNMGDRAVIPYESEVDRNLRYLRLKLHGIFVPENSMEGITDLRQLYDDILSDTSNSNQAWGGICVAMLTAPEFMAY